MNKTYILHVDMNNYFASIEMLEDSTLSDNPFCVIGDPNFRHGIILSRNNLAKQYNIIAGESLYSALKKCPNLKTRVADYHKYYSYTQKIRSIFKKYTKFVFPYSLDEAWLDISESVKNVLEAKFQACLLKNEIESTLNLKCAIGLSFNFVFSKLGSDRKLENDCFVIDYDNYQEMTKNIPLFELLMVGEKTRKAMRNMNILTIGDLRNADKNIIKEKFGKKGIELYNFSYGDDYEFQKSIKENEIKSLGNTITLPKDINDYNDISKFLYYLSYIIAKRLKNHQLFASQIALNLKYDDFSTSNHQKTFSNKNNDFKLFYETIMMIYNQYTNEKNVRALGIRVMKLEKNTQEQLSLFEEENSIDNEELEMKRILESLKYKYTNFELNV